MGPAGDRPGMASAARPRLIAVEGISGAGKSTVVARAAAAFGWVPLAEAYDRLDPRPPIGAVAAPALARVERTLLAEEARRYRAARALVAGGATVIADTGFLGPLTYSAALAALGLVPRSLLDDLLARTRRLAARGGWGVPDLTVYLATRPATRRRRVARDPARHPPALAARHEAAGRIEARFYAELLPRALPGRVRRVAADRPVEGVVAALGRAARSIAPAAPSGAPARRVLRLFARFSGPPGAGAATVKKSPLSAGAPLR